ncbi:bifunctional riboflavin kinase/FAD synthetase [Egibacter rhizosphaerae]|uniref:Riboflavin biosynthesis protein n=1 Tax=Egibacter rhizosphaerae TaxID=1670831 RepID=A0A411YCK2_9ACTN|nr:bifunctional riboflavin kinase/FAD synthetase [Egibacter rhizosphaerae]QBI18944.1 bifunctional riboflavin kinase/FAD synthetase [Egibacter rhizosphaerae]
MTGSAWDELGPTPDLWDVRVVGDPDAVEPRPSAVSIGFFDGVHRGHRTIIERALQAARQQSLRSVVVTFDRHPMEVVRPGSQPPLLQTLPRRAATLASTGVDLVVVLPFDDDLRHRAPDAFVDKVLAGSLRAAHVVVGANFRFGHRAAGDVDVLRALGEERGFVAEPVDLRETEGAVISSTTIRDALAEGGVELAARMLGRPHVIDGIVVRGDQRGRELGFPTANLQVDPRIALPASGVYAGWLHHPDGRQLPAATSVGTNPTFAGEEQRVEAYLLGVDEDLYGLEVALDFRARVRDEIRYEGPSALVAQMREDVAEVARLLGV